MYADLLRPTILKFEGQPRDSHGRFSTAWQQVGGKLGSNAGGLHMYRGDKYYAKFPKNPDQVHAEVAADKIHEMLGCKTINHKAVAIRGQTGSVTEWKDDIKPLRREGWLHLDDRQKQQAANAFVASALTKNWDLVGLAYDNMCKDKNGDLRIVDTGGSFNFRAMGDHKDFDGDANKEIDNFLNPEKTSGRVFRPLAQANPQMFRTAAKQLRHVNRDDFVKATEGMKDQQKIVDTLMERRASIMTRFHV